ncbi:Transposon TX1 uncharacterized 149 kDa protein [Vitis vinifera]|uniref:Transposon TX1 uncharacterized 149 kDa protein n=1 Tax=Vitis vinifera TaxID=29760 RepID=A0A438I074_VITVI|nr:Transposon TX1 uncharacterized 149 kDa protein [Vitis vinifera]
MTLEPDERIRFGCWLCWVVFVYMKILSWNTKRIRFQEEKEDHQKVFKYSKSRCCGASGNKESNLGQEFKCTEKVLGSFSVTVKLNSGEEGSFWLTSMYGPNKPLWRKDLLVRASRSVWSDLPKVVCRRDFNVIRRISEKMGDSRFENMWLLHPEFKEKFRDWWQECTVEGWEGHKFMRKLKFVKSKLKEWNIVAFGDLRERKKHILSDLGDSWRIEGIDWVPISGESAVWLDRPFSEEEVRMAVFQLNKEKAPGPDGFTIAVYQECWDVIKEDLMRVFLEFHTKGPISLVTSLYKIIAKVLSGRLRKVLHETISGSQGAFVEGRHILDAVLIANEVVDEKRRSCASKEGVQPEMEILDKGLFVFISFAILVNGNAKGWVKASRASMEHLQNLKIILLVFGQVSGLKINLEKSTISGLPLGGNPKTIGFWDPVVERISRRLDVSIASKIEKMQRDFLWSGGEGKKDHLIRWELLVDQRVGRFGFGKTSMRNIALLGKWLWRFPRERSGLWHKVIASIYGTHPNGWDANMVVRWSHRCPWKAIAQVFQIQERGLCLRQVVFSEIFFLALSKVSNPICSFRPSFLEFKSPSKVKALAWLVAHGKEMESRLTTFFFIVRYHWTLAQVVQSSRVGLGPSKEFEDMLVITFKGLGNSLRQDTLANCLPYFDLDGVAREKNRIFEDKGRTEEMLWI